LIPWSGNGKQRVIDSIQVEMTKGRNPKETIIVNQPGIIPLQQPPTKKERLE
jgi:hypothetical protein